MPQPTIVASENGRKGVTAAMNLLRNGGSALEAIELACRITEDDPDDHSVGYSGLPNLLGQVELDASIMDGRTLRTGAVAAVHNYGNPITIARQVMEELPHVLLVGAGAERFAAEMGHQTADQRSEESLAKWRQRFADNGLDPAELGDNLRAVAHMVTRPVDLKDKPVIEPPLYGKAWTLGTVNFLAVDQHGDMASGVSTSGIAWKYPGRVGDTPIVGAGNYADNRYGAAACTGMGEMAIRVSTARSLVLYMKMGMSLHEAGLEALRDLSALETVEGRYMNIVALTPAGQHQGFTTDEGRKYLHMSADMGEPELLDRTGLTE